MIAVKETIPEFTEKETRVICVEGAVIPGPFKSTQEFNKFLCEMEAKINAEGEQEGIKMVEYRTPRAYLSLDASTFVMAHYLPKSLNKDEAEKTHTLILRFTHANREKSVIIIEIAGVQRIIAVAEKLNREVENVRQRPSLGPTDSYLKSFLQDNVHEFTVNLLYFSKYLTGVSTVVRD